MCPSASTRPLGQATPCLLLSISGCYPDSDENVSDKVEGQAAAINSERGVERVAGAQKRLDMPACLKMAWWRGKSLSLLIFDEMASNFHWCFVLLLQNQLCSVGSHHMCLFLFLWLQCPPLPWTFSLSYRAAVYDCTDCALQKSRWYHSYCMRWLGKSSLRNHSTSLPLDSHYSYSLTNIWRSIKCQVLFWVLGIWQ